ncbi:MAG: dTDP-4-dehydrorhamnose reductase [Anaerolineaceae bacterium]|jgi:dTDP-4-dehydrorhamnose reductase|nr:dTDP-4-dehydrorhamnose reductase [Anaerolineaceae bacterium]
MKKILQIGTIGQLGWELLRTCAPLGEVVALDYPDVDLSDSNGLRELVRSVKPDIIINAAAYTNVDKAESEPELARAINAIGPGVLAEEAKKIDAVMVHYSTDYVFDGTKGSPYVETDQPNPLNVYGQTKLEGEQAVAASGCVNLVLRTSWVYSMRQGGFVTKVLQWARTQEVMRVVDDQISGPTSARLLAEMSALLLAKLDYCAYDWLEANSGVFHIAGDGACSRYEWAQKILQLDPHKEEQVVKTLERASSSEFPVPAERPMISVLNNDKLEKNFGLRLPSWEVGLRLTLI